MMTFEPGDFAVWHSGSAMMSWPPDGHFFKCSTQLFEILCPKVDTVTLIIARNDNHGAVVLVHERLWWSPLSSLRGELSSSFVVSF